MADELAGGKAGVQVPETEGLVPRGREGELAVRRDDDVRDEVVVAVEDLLGETERRLVAGELPDDDGLVWEMSAGCSFTARKIRPATFKPPFSIRTTRSGEDHVGVLAGGSDGSNPAGVAGKGSLENERLAHFVCFLVVVVWVVV